MNHRCVLSQDFERRRVDIPQLFLDFFTIVFFCQNKKAFGWQRLAKPSPVV
jgi:hypothetical protein